MYDFRCMQIQWADIRVSFFLILPCQDFHPILPGRRCVGCWLTFSRPGAGRRCVDCWLSRCPRGAGSRPRRAADCGPAGATRHRRRCRRSARRCRRRWHPARPPAPAAAAPPECGARADCRWSTACWHASVAPSKSHNYSLSHSRCYDSPRCAVTITYHILGLSHTCPSQLKRNDKMR